MSYTYKGNLAGSNIYNTRERLPKIPHISVDLEEKMRRALSAYIGCDFHIKEKSGSRRIGAGIVRDHARLVSVYPYNALFEVLSGMDGTYPVRFSVTFQEAAKGFVPAQIKKGRPWPTFDGEVVAEERED